MNIENRFDVAVDNEIEAFLKSQSFDLDPATNLISPLMKKERMKAEIKEMLQMEEFEQHVRKSLKIIKIEGAKYLENHHSIMKELFESAEILSSLDIEQYSNENFKEILKISDATLHAIEWMACIKFEEHQFSDSLSLFTFLALIVPINFEYWLRAGIAAQCLDNIDVAIRNYNVSIQINPQLIPPYLFISECYLKQGKLDEAIKKRDAAKEVLSGTQDQKSWDEFITSIDNLIKNLSKYE